MHRHLRLMFIAAAVLALASLAGPAAAAQQGTFSIGGNFGTGIYSNSDINDELEVSGYEEITSGWEYGGSLRYQVSPRIALDLEVNRMNPASTTEVSGNPDVELSTPGLAIPLNLYFLLSENDQYAFNLFAGAGMVTSSKFKAEQGGIEDEVDAESSFYGQLGVEAQWMLSPQFSLGARALGRMAKAELEADPGDPTFDVDYSGVAFGLGARLSFGGGGE